MVALLFLSLASAGSLHQDLLAAPSPEAEEALLRQAMNAAPHEDKRGLMIAIAVVSELESTDPAVRAAYLTAALSADSNIHQHALLAARAGGAVGEDGQPIILETLISPEEEPAAVVTSTADPAALEAYGSAWLAIGKQVSNNDTARVVTAVLSAGAGEILILPEITTTWWSVYRGGTVPLKIRAFNQTLREEGIEPTAWGVGPVPDSLPLEEARSLVDAHNAALRLRLGLSEEDVFAVELEAPDSVWQPGTEIRW
jgi:hypothetical protein